MKLSVMADGSLLPVEALSRKRIMEAYAEGEILDARIPIGGRRWGQHAAYHADVREFAENLPEAAVEHFYKIILGDMRRYGEVDPELVHELLKRICGIDSEAFDKLPQEEADAFFRQAHEVLERWKTLLGG